MGTQLTIRATDDQITELQEVADECRLQLLNTTDQFKAGFIIAAATRRLTELVTDDMMEDVMALQGSALGFRTDKDRDSTGAPGKGYPVATVKACFIEATVRGFRSVNNEWNIIADRFYGAQTGFVRMVKTYPGLTNFDYSLSVPAKSADRATVEVIAKWELHGTPMEFRRGKKSVDGQPFDDSFVVRINRGMGDDAILGKATRKMFAAIYDVITGSVLNTPAGDLADSVDVSSRPVSKVKKSTLFDDAPVEPVDTGPNEADQECYIGEYKDQLDQCEAKSHVGPIAKQSGGDGRLSKETKTKIAEMCTKKLKTL